MRTSAPLLLVLAVAGSALVGSTRSSRAGPLEAEARYEQARSLAGAPWHQRATALRSVLAEAHPSNSLYRRALKALASTCRKAGLPHAATAYAARAARLGPRSERGRISATLDLARALRGEGDRDAAAALLAQVAEAARGVAPKLADRARAAQAEDLEAARDVEGLEALVGDMKREDAAASRRLEALDALGVLRLETGDRPGATRALERAERVYRRALRQDDDEATRCARAWLRLRLPGRLAP